MLKILIVDDEQVVRVYLQSIVNWEQYDCQVVTTCGNGIEALEVMAQQPIDLILTDLEMPKMNGLQLIEEIRSRGYQTKVIVLSDHSDYDLIREAMKLGALDYYVKTNVKEADIISMIELVSEQVKKQLLQKDALEEEKRLKIDNFKIGRKTFLTTVLTGDVYYNELQLSQYVKMYHLFEPRLSLYQLRFQQPIELRQFLYVDAIIAAEFQKYDHDVVHLTQEKILVALYERTIVEEQVLMDHWLRIVKNIKNYLRAELQASKRLLIDSTDKLTSCTKLFQNDVPGDVSPVIAAEELSHYRPEIQSILNYIHEHYDERITLQDLSAFACLNEAYLSRLFKMETKKTINSYINELRIYKAKELLKSPNIMVKEVAQLVGIKDQLYFNRVFKKFCGENPTDYQDRVKKLVSK